MTTTPIPDVPPVATVQVSLSQRLKAETAGQHDRMESLICLLYTSDAADE